MPLICSFHSVHYKARGQRMLFAQTNINPLPILSADVWPRTLAYWGPDASQAGTVEEEGVSISGGYLLNFYY